MAIYRVNYFEVVVTEGERPTDIYFPVGSKLTDVQTGGKYTWSGSKWLSGETLFPPLIQEGRWDHNTSWGLLSSMTQYGTFSGNAFFLANSGRLASRFLTAESLNAVAGQRRTSLMTRRANEPSFTYSVQAGDASSCNHVHGFASYSTQIPTPLPSGNPFGSADSGIMIGFLAGGNFQVFYNDGGGTPPTPIDTGVAVNSGHLYQFGIHLEDNPARAIWFIRNLVNATNDADGEITTDLPASTTSMTAHWHVESTVATPAQNLYLATAILKQRG